MRILPGLTVADHVRLADRKRPCSGLVPAA